MSKKITLKAEDLKGIIRMAIKMGSMNLGAKQDRLVKAVFEEAEEKAIHQSDPTLDAIALTVAANGEPEDSGTYARTDFRIIDTDFGQVREERTLTYPASQPRPELDIDIAVDRVEPKIYVSITGAGDHADHFDSAEAAVDWIEARLDEAMGGDEDDAPGEIEGPSEALEKPVGLASEKHLDKAFGFNKSNIASWMDATLWIGQGHDYFNDDGDNLSALLRSRTNAHDTPPVPTDVKDYRNMPAERAAFIAWMNDIPRVPAVTLDEARRRKAVAEMRLAEMLLHEATPPRLRPGIYDEEVDDIPAFTTAI